MRIKAHGNCKIVNRLAIVVISIDYRLAPEYKYPTPNNDVFDVIQYVYSNAEKFNIDSTRMGLGGHSAGGTITVLVALMAKEFKAFALRSMILDYPCVDLDTPMSDKVREELTDYQKEFLDLCSFFDKCNYASKDDVKDYHCSSIYATKEQLQGLPPTIMVICENDLLKYEDFKFSKMLIEAGVEVTARMFQGAIHGFTADLYYIPEAEEAHQMMIDGIKKYLFS